MCERTLARSPPCVSTGAVARGGLGWGWGGNRAARCAVRSALSASANSRRHSLINPRKSIMFGNPGNGRERVCDVHRGVLVSFLCEFE